MNTLIKNTRIFTRLFNNKQVIKASSIIPQKTPISISLLPFGQVSRFTFCDKPPKGFENFQRRRNRPPLKEKTENPEEKPKEEKTAEKKQNEEKEERTENDDKNKKSESDNEDNNNNNNNDNKGDNNKGNDRNDHLINAGLCTLVVLVCLKLLNGTSNKEITMIV